MLPLSYASCRSRVGQVVVCVEAGAWAQGSWVLQRFAQAMKAAGQTLSPLKNQENGRSGPARTSRRVSGFSIPA